MVNKNVLFLFLIIFSLSIVSAEITDTRFYHPQDTNLTIYEKCRVDGSVCDNTYVCSITVLSPTQDLLIDDETMLGDGVYRNFTLLSDNQTENGIYESTVDCTNVTLSGSNTFTYGISLNGSPPMDVGQGLIILGGLLFIIVISISIGFLGVKSTNTTVSLSFIALSVLLMVFTLGSIVRIVELSFGTFSDIVSNFSTVYILFTTLTIVGAFGLIVYTIVVALNYYLQLRGLKDTFSVN